MGIFGGKSKPKDSNYINFNSAYTSPYAQTAIEEAMMKDLGYVRQIQPSDLFKYLGTPRHLVEITFPDRTLRICNDPYGDIMAGGKRFISDGTLQAFEDSEETPELNQRGLTVTLSSDSDTLITLFNTLNYVRAPVSGYHAYMDHTTGSNVPLFVIEFSRGFIDQPKFVYNNLTGKSEFKITTTSILEKLNNATGARTANAVHQANFPGDNFFKYANSTQDSKKKIWKML